MSYCVECGVELDSSAKKCALCGTHIVNPNRHNEEEAKAPFSEEKFVPKEIHTRFIAGIVTLVMTIPNIVCFLLNAVFFSDSFWSFYVLSTSFLMWVVCVVPFFLKKHRTYFIWAFDTAAIALYVYFFFAMQKGGDWYYDCALPIVLFNAFLVLIYIIWVRRKKRHSLLKALFIFSDIALGCLVSGLLLDIEGAVWYAGEAGIIIFLCIVAVLIFLTVCYCSKTVREWLSKKLFV